MPVYSTDPSFCLLDQIQTQISQDGSAKHPSFITYANNEIKIMTTDVTMTGSYVFTVTAALDTVFPTAKFKDTSVTF